MQPAVLITGGARRIGALLTRGFAKAGWHVVIHYGASRAEAEALAANLPSAETAQCDLSNPEAARAFISTLAGRLDNWRVLVNCAAVLRPDRAETLVPDLFNEAIRVNAQSPVMMAQEFLASARANGGRRVIQFTDMKLRNPNPDFFSYTLAKHALDAAIKPMAMAITDPADRVYGLAPGAMLPSFDQAPDEHLRSGRMNLLERLTPPGELAEAALFLAEGWLQSGETLFIDSGQHLLAQPRDVLYLARQ